jgi:hypothetical protein
MQLSGRVPVVQLQNTYLSEYLQHLPAGQPAALHSQPVKLIEQGAILQ